jgi:hypothetical protein
VRVTEWVVRKVDWELVLGWRWDLSSCASMEGFAFRCFAIVALRGAYWEGI